MALFEDFGNIDTGNPFLNFLSGFDTTANSTKTNVSALPQAAAAEAQQKKKDEEEEERKRKKREAEKKKAMQQALPRRNTGAVGDSTTPSTSPMASYRGLGKNPNTRIKQYEGTVGL